MRISLWATLRQPWADLAEVVQHVDAAGWDTVYVADHFMGDATPKRPLAEPVYEATAAVTAIAVLTSRVRVAPFVLGNTYRHPAVVASWAATVDHASNGRLLLGLGAGWQENEHDHYGIPMGPPGERVVRFEEALQVIRGLLDDPVTTFRGEHYVLTDAVCEPKPVQDRLPILVGAEGDRMLRLVARWADEWNSSGDPARIGERRRFLDAACEAAGRAPSAVRMSTQSLIYLTEDRAEGDRLAAEQAPRVAVAGSIATVAERVAEYAAVGADEFIIPDETLGSGPQRLETLDALFEALRPI